MKPYFYIVAVLMVGGGIGYFIGQRTVAPGSAVSPSNRLASDDRTTIEGLLSRQKDAYAAHDELLLFRDCAAGYLEVNATTGEMFNLQAAVIRHHELFRPGKTVSVLFGNLDISLMQNSALVRDIEVLVTSDESISGERIRRDKAGHVAGQSHPVVGNRVVVLEITQRAKADHRVFP